MRTSRYGKRIREDYDKVMKKTRAKYKCPSCSRLAVRRSSAGVWVCRKCNARFASGAYEFKE